MYLEGQSRTIIEIILNLFEKRRLTTRNFYNLFT